MRIKNMRHEYLIHIRMIGIRGIEITSRTYETYHAHNILEKKKCIELIKDSCRYEYTSLLYETLKMTTRNILRMILNKILY